MPEFTSPKHCLQTTPSPANQLPSPSLLKSTATPSLTPHTQPVPILHAHSHTAAANPTAIATTTGSISTLPRTQAMASASLPHTATTTGSIPTLPLWEIVLPKRRRRQLMEKKEEQL
ncbi:hypothetical protein ACFE04_005904 [Oxalis oulophora]